MGVIRSVVSGIYTARSCAGPALCVGMKVGLTFTIVAVVTLLHRFPA